mgnify:CR=1 FL=1
MKRFQLLLAIVALGFTAACNDAPDTVPTDTETLSSAAITLEGDFDGPLGLQLWSVRHEMEQDVRGTLARVHEMGFREVETAGTYGMSAEAFRQVLDSVGLEVTAAHVPFERLRDSTDAVLDEAEILGAEYVGIAWYPHPEGQPFTEALARQAAADFNRIGQAARERGLRFFYHNHGYEFQPYRDGTLFDLIVQQTDPELVDFEIDVFWTARPGQDPAALLRKYPDRWKLMHVKDMAQGTPMNDLTGHATEADNVAVGSGQLDYAAILQAAEEIGLEHYYIEDETSAPMQNIPLSIQYLETLRYDSTATAATASR